MPISLNEIKTRALAFSNEWQNETSEDAEAKSFWDGFFFVFGITRRRTATFEQKVHKSEDKQGYIDLLWKGVLLIEHKSRGKDLNRAYQQAKDYFPGIKEKDLPRYIMVSDFANIKLYDLEEGWNKEFKLNELVDNIDLFGFISGYRQHVIIEQDQVNIKAALKMGELHDQLKAIGFSGHELELYLVRLLFCLFADTTNIFEKGIFREYIEIRTAEDGSDLAMYLDSFFQVLNTPNEKRLLNIDEQLAAFPYVNGKLFEERLATASFDKKMRQTLLECCQLDWAKISPAIFGSLFQSVMDVSARRNLGAHYTSELNILKVIKPLFLDELWAEFEKLKRDRKPLDTFHKKIAQLRFLDPACGCGNFLIIAYRELRLLEIELLKAKFKNQIATNIDNYINVNVDQFYGIEYEEFPAQIAQVAMWLVDHQMNQLVSQTFGQYFVRLPLTKHAKIVHGNALQIDWQSIMNKMPWDKRTPRYNFILGNPPFIGKQLQDKYQKKDMQLVFNGVKSAGLLDYVACWYIKAAKYLTKSNIKEDGMPKTKCAFVSTNSITQGEQVGVLWNEMFNTYKIKIHFAHRTFRWSNEAKGNAAVHVIIIGFANFDIENKNIFEYDNINGIPKETIVKNINPYLVDAKDIVIISRRKPICSVTEISFGNMPNDDGNFLLDETEKTHLINNNILYKKYIKQFIGGREFLNGEKKWCLWLVDAIPNEINKLKIIKDRIESVKIYRINSQRETTKKLANFPMLFGEIRQPKEKYILIPCSSSENRKYIPIDFFSKDTIIGNTCLSIQNESLFVFGILTSEMHMTWVRYTCGRIKSDFRYSNSIVYNNYPWPENPSDKQIAEVEKAVKFVFDARSQFPESTLAQLYTPNIMPPSLIKAHQALDKAVDLCYRPQTFISDTKRIEFLFELYDKFTAGLFVEQVKKKKTIKQSTSNNTKPSIQAVNNSDAVTQYLF